MPHVTRNDFQTFLRMYDHGSHIGHVAQRKDFQHFLAFMSMLLYLWAWLSYGWCCSIERFPRILEHV